MTLFSLALFELQGVRTTPNAYFSPLTHIQQLLLLTFCDTPAGIGATFRTHTQTYGQMDGQKDLEVEIVI